MATIQSFFQALNPFSRTVNPAAVERNLGRFIAPVQLQRFRHDVQMWREAITEAENAWYPHRVRMQRMFIDTILSGHTLACRDRRNNLTLMREWCFKDANGNENEDLKKLFDKPWFSLFKKYVLDAQAYGYSLVSLGDCVDGNFKDLSIIRRWNVSPDRKNVTSLVYALQGIDFTEEPYRDWHIYVSTPSETGQSICGYGYLYNVALYEIMCRNLLGNNADAVELYSMPTRIGTTNKAGEERQALLDTLINMGSAGAVVIDELDKIEFVESKGNGQGFKLFPDFEQRLEKKISKIILGHADAMDSTPGKLGGGQGEESPVHEALESIKMADGALLEDVVNNELIPRLINIGFAIDANYKFCFDNNSELQEQRCYEDDANLKTAQIAQTLKNAGLDVDAAYIEERTGIKVTKAAAPAFPAKPMSKEFKNKLSKLYE